MTHNRTFSKTAVVIPMRSVQELQGKERDHVVNLLNITIGSVMRSDWLDYRIYVCGSGDLVGLECSDRLQILDLRDFAPETVATARSEPTTDNLRSDMYAKRLYGARTAIEAGAARVLFLDADDLVHKSLFSFVAEHPETASWLAGCGLEYMDRTQRVYVRKRHFAARCGSCAIVGREKLIQKFGILAGRPSLGTFHHHAIVETVSKNCRILPFPAFVYRTDHGANMTLGLGGLRRARLGTAMNYVARNLVKLALSRPYTQEDLEAYGDPEICATQFVGAIDSEELEEDRGRGEMDRSAP
jgi:hypothetical protein